MTSPPRLPSLDGLRGIAAFTVLIHHCMLVAPSFSHAFLNVHRGPVSSSSWWLTYTPLHAFWAGGEAVLLFFVLSGFVLALPWASGRSGGWAGYYPRRILRLYAPLAGAMLAAYVLTRATTRGPDPRASDWLNVHPSYVSKHALLHDALVVKGVDNLNTPLWSLQWEVLFSLLLPGFVFLLVRHRPWPLAKFVLLLAITAASGAVPGHHEAFGISLQSALQYLPIFGLGVVMAQQRALILELGRRFDHAPRRTRAVCGAAVLLLMFAYWFERASHTTSDVGLSIARAGQILACCAIVAYFAATRRGRAIGTHPVAAWLGRRSFSLYLIHEPIVVTVAFALGATHNIALVLLVAAPLSLLASDLFYRLVEGPAHRLSQRVGRLTARQSVLN